MSWTMYVIAIGMGLMFIVNPRSLYDLTMAFRVGRREPSKLSLNSVRITGGAMILFGVLGFLT